MRKFHQYHLDDRLDQFWVLKAKFLVRRQLSLWGCLIHMNGFLIQEGKESQYQFFFKKRTFSSQGSKDYLD
jgi:hypothetical protein